MGKVLDPNSAYPWLERDYNENLSRLLTDGISAAVVDYRIPEAKEHPGLYVARSGDLYSPLIGWRPPAVDIRGVQTNGRRY